MGTREFFRSLKEQLGDKIKIELYFNAPFGSTAMTFSVDYKMAPLSVLAM